MQDSRNKYLREEYRSRVNRVIDYIEANLGNNLTLQELAGVAHFSPFHFHRLFRAMVGETLNEFTQRIRVEKGASKLIQNPKLSITAIASECGFSSPSTFARAFRDAFKMSASEWRISGQTRLSKECKTAGNQGQQAGKQRKDFDILPYYIQGISQQVWRISMKDKAVNANIEVRDMPEMHVAYVRHIGPYKGDSELFSGLFNKLMSWAGPRGLLRFPDTRVLTIYYDNPDITDESRLRTDACITIPEDTSVSGEVGKAKIPAGKYAIAHFEIMPDQYQDAWDVVYGGWLPESGYQPGDGPCYEQYYGNPKQHPQGKHVLDICIPVKPL